MSERYRSIINQERIYSEKHPPMSAHDRAAQFAPFAALTGFDAEINEKGRLTENRIEPGEDLKEALDRRLQQLLSVAARHPEISLVYFVPDEKKQGGAYMNVKAHLKKFDEEHRKLIMTDGRKIALEDIMWLDGDIAVNGNAAIKSEHCVIEADMLPLW